MNIDTLQFLKLYTAWDTKLTSEAKAGLSQILDALNKDLLVLDPRWAAYMLATVKLECGNAWAPVTEHGARSYFDQYESTTAKGQRLGNTQAGDGYNFRGRGYVQITGRTNYTRASSKLGLGTTLVETPEGALHPPTAYSIMSYGMRTGMFTGAKLSTYLHGDVCDYIHARRIINGSDRAEAIAAYATELESMLRSSMG